MIIGITGPSGSGKSTVARQLGFKLLDCDKMYHELLATNKEMQNKLVLAFGTASRNDLSQIVFNNKEKLEKLNSIVFVYVLKEIENWLQRADNMTVVIDAPLLFEYGLDKKCDLTIALLANKDERIKRIILRDNISKERAEARINSGKPDDFYSNANLVLVNNNVEDVVLKIKKEIEKRG